MGATATALVIWGKAWIKELLGWSLRGLK